MQYGISGQPLPTSLPYAQQIQAACEVAPTFSPMLAYAIKVNESGENDPPDVQSDDGGHGLFQLTSSWPSNWTDPYTNALYAVQHFLIPAAEFWNGTYGYTGDDLIRCVAAEFNAGRGNALAGHANGNVDQYTTEQYATRALAHYRALAAGQSPFGDW